MYLPIFPSGYLSHSVITTVWIGIFVIAFFNLRFGWIFSGLVVPGYLTPLLLIKPLSVAVIVSESVLTYLLVYLISEVAGRYGVWTNFFGRDRFFALLLGSVFVRLVCDGFALPWLNAWSIEEFGILLDYQDSLHSFGLIIVALIANQLWKPKLFNGLLQLTVTVGITYLIVRYVLVEYTNFSLSNIGYLYEDIAGSILASPKSYIILLVTAFIASRMNLFYGWEFNGILIPSLLALQWYQPSKIFISLIEAYVIFVLVVLFLKIPWFKNINVEGARKVLLFFNIGYLYKILLSLFIVKFFPEYKVSDYFGFGYLLSTLIAIKIYDKISIPMFTRITLQTSVISVIIATIIGYALTLISLAPLYTYSKDLNATTQKVIHTSDKSLIQFVEEKKIMFYYQSEQIILKPTPNELHLFEHLLSLIEKGFEIHQKEISGLLTKLDYVINIIQDRYLVISPSNESKLWGMYIIDMQQKGNLSLEVPFPFESGNMIESAVALMNLLEAKVVAFGVENRANDIGPNASQSNDYYSFFHLFHKFYAKNSVLQIRPLTNTYKRKFTALLPDHETSILFSKGYLPKGLNLSILKDKIGEFEVSWQNVTSESIQKKSMNNGFSELYLTKEDRIILASSRLLYDRGSEIEVLSSVKSVGGLLEAWLLERKLHIAEKGSNSYIEPTMNELMFMDHSIIAPILNILELWKDRNSDYDRMEKELVPIAVAAKSIGLQLSWYLDMRNRKRYIILYDDQKKMRYWGTYVFKVNESKNIMIQVPRPFYESNTFEYGIHLFNQLDAKVLLLSGANPLANDDRSSDIMLKQYRKNMFNLVNQVIYRQSGHEEMNALQIRGKGALYHHDESAVLAFNNGTTRHKGINAIQAEIFDYLNTRISVKVNDGSIESAGYHARSIQSEYLDQSINNTFNTLWLPYMMRYQHRQLKEDDRLIQQLRHVGIEIVTGSILDHAPQYEVGGTFCTDKISDQLLHYLEFRDIAELAELNLDERIRIKLFLDGNKPPYMVVFSEDQQQILFIIKYNALPPYRVKISEASALSADLLKAFFLDDSIMLKAFTPCER